MVTTDTGTKESRFISFMCQFFDCSEAPKFILGYFRVSLGYNGRITYLDITSSELALRTKEEKN